MILAGGMKPVKKLDGRGACVGFLRCALAKLDQRVRFFGSGREYPAGPVIFEGSSDKFHTVRDQGRGQRIAGVPRQRVPVPAELQDFGAVDLAAVDAIGLGHLDRPRACATSRASSTLMISCVSVLRVTTSQDRSPCS